MLRPESKVRPAPSPALLMVLRKWHAYIGMLIAPSVLFMAGTGIVQIYSLHEAHAGYSPPAIIERLGRIHKDQVFALPQRRQQAREQTLTVASHPVEAAISIRKPPPAKLATTALKAFFTAAALGLILSTIIGIWMALRQGQSRSTTYIALLCLGAFVPILLATLSA